MIVFLSGGARSGKSGLAERLSLSFYNDAQGDATPSKPVYLATSKRGDTEMEDRIDRHRNERLPSWETIEEPFDLERVLSQAKSDDVILLDCLTIWLSNVIFNKNYHVGKIKTVVNNVIKLAKTNNIHLFVVSNDVNEDIPHESDVVNEYIYALEKVHQQFAEEADKVVQVIAGIPVYWKG